MRGGVWQGGLAQLEGEVDLHSDGSSGKTSPHLVTWEQRPGGLRVSGEGQKQNSEAEACGACLSHLCGWKGVNWGREARHEMGEVALDPIPKDLTGTAGTLAFSRQEEGSLFLSKGGVI